MTRQGVATTVADLLNLLRDLPGDLPVVGAYDAGRGYSATVVFRLGEDPRWVELEPRCLVVDLE